MTMTSGERLLNSLQAFLQASATAFSIVIKAASAGSLFTAMSADCKQQNSKIDNLLVVLSCTHHMVLCVCLKDMSKMTSAAGTTPSIVV